jgi:hypothetical protein
MTMAIKKTEKKEPVKKTAAKPTKAKVPDPKRKPEAKKPEAKKPEAPAPTYQMIARRAYEIWEGKGRPGGTEAENWAQAERELRGQG